MMSLRLVSSVSNPVSFDDHPVSRLGYSPPRLSAVDDCNSPSGAVGQSGSAMRRRRADEADHPVIEDLAGCCQTDANSSQFGQVRRLSGGAESPPLGKSSGAVQLVGGAAGEAPLRVEEVVH